MNYLDFQQAIDDAKPDILKEVYLKNREKIRIKKEKTAVKNFEIILNAVFKISYAKGFQAMSMRDLSSETGLSMGALYGYFASKEELFKIIQGQGRSLIKTFVKKYAEEPEDPQKKLRAVIKAHIYLSEVARPWFYFTFMEARDLDSKGVRETQALEAYTEKILVEVLTLGEQKGIFAKKNHLMTASIIKAMQQDWYLKRWKYSQRDVDVETYADTVIEFTESYCLA